MMKQSTVDDDDKRQILAVAGNRFICRVACTDTWSGEEFCHASRQQRDNTTLSIRIWCKETIAESTPTGALESLRTAKPQGTQGMNELEDAFVLFLYVRGQRGITTAVTTIPKPKQEPA
jgi:hypothetical protein